MSIVLFLSPNENMFHALRRMMPDAANLVWIKKITQVYQYLQNKQEPVILLIIDGTRRPELSAYCHDLSVSRGSEKLPTLVLIDSLAARQVVMSNGADGYLLMPLLEAEVKSMVRQSMARHADHVVQLEMQNNTAQIAYMLLIARIIIETSGLGNILSKVLQQVVNIFNADGGEIWLLGEDNTSLTLESSLFITSFSVQRNQHYKRGRGLIGRAIEQVEPLVINDLTSDTRYEPSLDFAHPKMATCCFLATNLHVDEKKVGVLALYRQSAHFTPAEVFLLGELSSLVAAGIDNTQALQSIHYYAEQQHVLYEMSRQISAGLDLNTTLKRAAQWVVRLTDAEIGLIWLTSENGARLESVTGIGLDLPEKPHMISSDDLNFSRSSIVVNDPAVDVFTQKISQILDIYPQNALILPIKQRGRLLGMLTLFNKISGPFLEAEEKLLTTALEMIAISIGNARLFKQTRLLMEERERLHQKALQNERLRTLGRLTASVAHEINNPMQAIRGALALALEELNSPVDLQEYIRLSQQEAERVIKLVYRMRQLYRPASDQVEAIQILNLLRDVLEISRDEMTRQNIKTVLQFPVVSPVCFAITNHLHLAFLTILLNLTDAMGENKGGSLTVRVADTDDKIKIEFIITPAINSVFNLDEKPENAESIESQVGMITGFSPVVDALAASGGKINAQRHEDYTHLIVELDKGEIKTKE
ncbi:MAG: GAF domain-containing protein [Anaerolineae bacterium]|nr:GAF domain-containing protein [Anaerolineae bacterium]